MSVEASPDMLIENFFAKGFENQYTQIARALVSITGNRAFVDISLEEEVSELEKKAFDTFLKTVQEPFFCEHIKDANGVYGSNKQCSIADVAVLAFRISEGIDEDLLEKTKSVVLAHFPHLTQPKE